PIALGTFLGTIGVIISCVSMVRSLPLKELGIAVRRNEQPRLWDAVSQMAARLNTSPPDNIVLSMQSHFYVTACDVVVQNRPEPMRGETLCLALPLMRIMDLTEISSIIGHELCHFREQDVAYSKKFAPIYAHMSHAFQLTSAAKGVAQLPFLPIYAVLGF